MKLFHSEIIYLSTQSCSNALDLNSGTSSILKFESFKEGYTTLWDIGSLYLTLYTLIDTVSPGQNLIPPPLFYECTAKKIMKKILQKRYIKNYFK